MHYPRSGIYIRFTSKLQKDYRNLKQWHFLSASSLGVVLDAGLATVKLITLLNKLSERS